MLSDKTCNSFLQQIALCFRFVLFSGDFIFPSARLNFLFHFEVPVCPQTEIFFLLCNHFPGISAHFCLAFYSHMVILLPVSSTAVVQWGEMDT